MLETATAVSTRLTLEDCQQDRGSGMLLTGISHPCKVASAPRLEMASSLPLKQLSSSYKNRSSFCRRDCGKSLDSDLKLASNTTVSVPHWKRVGCALSTVTEQVLQNHVMGVLSCDTHQ